MNTVALNGGTEAGDGRITVLKERIARFVRNYFAEYGTEIACGMLAMTGNAGALKIMYQMLRK